MPLIQEIKKLLENYNFLYRPLVIIQNKIYNNFYPGYNQISNFTTANRYPGLFQLGYNEFKDKKDLRILSFGCSTGEECFSLQKHFKDAFILGVDINKNNISKAVKADFSHKILFKYSTKENIMKFAPYDLILAMSVLCRWPASRYYHDISKLYPFAKFEKQLVVLDEALNPGGILMIANSNYLFSDSNLAVNYIKLPIPMDTEPDLVPKFAPSGKKLNIDNFKDFVFKKLPMKIS